MFSGALYNTLYLGLSSNIGIQILAALLSSTIFFAIVIYFPRKKENKIAKDFIIEAYNCSKGQIIGRLLHYFSKSPRTASEKKHTDYESIRELITEEDMDSLRNYNPKHFQTLNIEILYELNILKITLTRTLPYTFIKQNQAAYKRFNYLIQWIDQFHHAFNTYYRLDDDLEYSKWFCNFINEHIRGITVQGPQTHDNFIDIINNSYESSQFLYEFKLIFKKKKSLKKPYPPSSRL